MGNVFKFADHTKLFQQVNDSVDTRAMQEDLEAGVRWTLDRLVECADKWQMQFNVSQCKVMHIKKRKALD